MSVPVSVQNPSAYGSAAYADNSGHMLETVFSAKTLRNFYGSTALWDISNTDYEGEAKFNEKVMIRRDPDPTFTEYTKGKTVTFEDAETPAIALEINKAQSFAVKLDKIDMAQTKLKPLDRASEVARKKAKLIIETDVFSGAYTGADAANIGATGGAISGNIDFGTTAAPLTLVSATNPGAGEVNVIEWITRLSQGLYEQEVELDEGSGWILLPPKIASLIKNSDLKDASITGDGKSMLRNGRLGMIDRFTLYVNNRVPIVTVAGTPNVLSYQVMAGTKEALTFAMQLEDINYHEKLETTFGSGIKGLFVWGSKVVQPKALITSCVAK